MKTIVCRCEDVTRVELEHALAEGQRTVEDLKRFTGLGTGPCQGKECMALCARLAAAWPPGGRIEAPASMEPFVARPPLQPVPLGALAALDEEA